MADIEHLRTLLLEQITTILVTMAEFNSTAGEVLKGTYTLDDLGKLGSLQEFWENTEKRCQGLLPDISEAARIHQLKLTEIIQRVLAKEMR